MRFWGILAALAALAASCKQLPGPIVPDATPDGGCQVDDAVTAARLIRTADGAPLVVHCPDAGTP